MSPIIGGAIALAVMALCAVTFPDKKPKLKTDEQKLVELLRKINQK